MVKPVNTALFATATGRDWDGWRNWLDSAGAREMSHTDIAQKVFETGDATGWWSQSVAVAYEQHIGRRAPGQLGAAFRISVSRTLQGEPEAVRDQFAAYMAGREIDGTGYRRGPTLGGTERRRAWRCGLDDGSTVVATFEKRAPGKVLMALEHDKLADADAGERRRAFWKDVLGDFAILLS